MKKLMFFILYISIFVMLEGCGTSYLHENFINFDKKWKYADTVNFAFDIEDISAPYHIYYTIRHNDNYKNCNLFLRIHLQDPTGKLVATKIQENFLYDCKTGKPLGSGSSGAAYTHQFLIWEKYTFSQKGKYTLKMNQYMRPDTLLDIEVVGMQVEKISK